MKKTILALILACVGCCAIPFLLPALAGLGALALPVLHHNLTLDSLLCTLPPVLLALIIAYIWVRRFTTKKACASDGQCGCK
jgi:hypothetical protein